MEKRPLADPRVEAFQQNWTRPGVKWDPKKWQFYNSRKAKLLDKEPLVGNSRSDMGILTSPPFAHYHFGSFEQKVCCHPAAGSRDGKGLAGHVHTLGLFG